jgi:hypothetical protein
MNFAQQASYAAWKRPSNTYFNDDEYGQDMYERDEEIDEDDEEGEDE